MLRGTKPATAFSLRWVSCSTETPAPAMSHAGTAGENSCWSCQEQDCQRHEQEQRSCAVASPSSLVGSRQRERPSPP